MVRLHIKTSVLSCPSASSRPTAAPQGRAQPRAQAMRMRRSGSSFCSSAVCSAQTVTSICWSSSSSRQDR
eukprot:968178-Amphidinium_carterae.1